MVENGIKERTTKAERCRDIVLKFDKKYGGEMRPKELIFKIQQELDLSHVTATNYLYNARRDIEISRGAPVPPWLEKMRKGKGKKKSKTLVITETIVIEEQQKAA